MQVKYLYFSQAHKGLHMIKKVLKFIGAIVLIVGLYIGGNILYATLTDYQPPETEEVKIYNQSSVGPQDSVYSFLIWNIGYSGLGSEEDFFFDGGETVVASKERVEENFKGILKQIENRYETDFILLQEVDTLANRSYYTNQFIAIAKLLSGHNYSFATNYLVKFVPMPLTTAPWNTMGRVEAGLATYSKPKCDESIRYSFPGNYDWPTRVYFLDRCFLLRRHTLPSGKQMVVINTHNSAYDDGTLKAKQMEYLKDILVDEYEKGNYVVVGGDWNQSPPNFDVDQFNINREVSQEATGTNISADYLPGWTWAYDPAVPTNRSLLAPFDDNTTRTGLIDFYLVSPNIQVTKVEGIDLNFRSSDHQPVYMEVKLK